MTLRVFLIAIAVFTALLPGSAQSGSLWSFEYPDDTFRSDALLDLRYLNEEYAGSGGFIRLSADSCSFATSSGQEIRFWAVNGATEANEMDDETLAHFARFLAKQGVNMIRYHGSLHPRNPYAPIGEADNGEISNIQRVVTAMKLEGIYTTVSLFYTHMVDMVPESWKIPGYAASDKKLSGVIFFHEGLKDALKSWISSLLSADNPYSGIRLKDEAALALIQIQNEDGLFFYTVSNVSREMKDLMGRKFYEKIVKKYGSYELARDAWNGAEISGDNPATGTLELYNIYDATLSLSGAKAARMHDQIEFFLETQKDFYREIYDHIRASGAKQLVNAGNWKTASSTRLFDAERLTNMECDVLAVNRYYSPGHVGTNSSWRIDPGHYYEGRSVLFNPARLPVNIKQPAARPFIVSESGWNLPHKYQAEGPFLVSAYSSVSGLDIFYWFTASAPAYDPNPYFHWTNLQGGQHPLNRWTISTPGQMAMFPANALMFRKGYIQEEENVIEEHRSLNSILDREVPVISEETGFDPNRDSYNPATEATECNPLSYLAGRVIVDYNSGKDTALIDPGLSSHLDTKNKLVSSMRGELNWDYKNGIVELNTPKAKGICGFLSGKRVFELGAVTIASSNEYAVVDVVSMDGLDLTESTQVLIQTGTVYRPDSWQEESAVFDNKGVSTEGFLIKNTGSMPWKGVPAEVTVTIRNRNVIRASQLDAAGYLKKRLVLSGATGERTIVLPPDALYVILDSNPVSAEEPASADGSFRVYPTVSDGKVKVSIPEHLNQPGLLEIFDLNGRLLLQHTFYNTVAADIDLSRLSKGMYYATYTRQESVRQVQKLIIR